MSDRVQIDCLKQGSVDPSSWSVRVLTIDLRTGTLTISRRGQPGNVFYHALKPSTVQQWPHFNREVIEDPFNSIEAKRTVCLLGITAAVPCMTVVEVAMVGIPVPASTPTTPLPPSPPSTAQQLDGLPLPPCEHLPVSDDPSLRKKRMEKPGRHDCWILRFPSQASHDVAVQLLRTMRGVRFAGEPMQSESPSHAHDQHVLGAVVV